ncbi:MAG: 16S rRNA (cytidine(1402)-2'-O)-methyltransferase [Gemmatimonadetes bacterium]|nr:16S rRNA (cytidine(1402)-2'-O)-methyltransferase [Gemmatimonadota bacterium]
MSQLYIVSTPIGNLGDITYRAVEVLGAVDRILAEDTRRTSILLRHYGIATPLVSAHAHNEAARAARIVGWLDAGLQLALVSDAGTPLISDPGARIVQRVIAAGHRVVPVPGPSALLAALAAGGVDPEPFTFYGFVPRSGRARVERLEEISRLRHAAVLYEAPGRLAKLLRDLTARCEPSRQVVVARELTKVHESVVRGTLAVAAAYYENQTPRAEVVVGLAGAAAQPAGEEDVQQLAQALLAEGRPASGVARELGRRLGVPRRRAYQIVLSLVGEGGGEAE